VAQLLDLDIGRPLQFHISPTDDAMVFGNHRFELVHIDFKTRKMKVLDTSRHGRIYSVDWSPDGQWVAYNFSTSLFTSAIKLCRVESGETHFVTPPNTAVDYGPSFDPAGRYLHFLSRRDFDPVYDSHYFELSFPRGGRPYLVTLQKDLPNPFIPLPGEKPAEEDCDDNESNNESNGDKKESNGEAAATPPSSQPPEKKPTQIDLDDIQQRVVAFPVPESIYHQIRGVVKNKVLFTSFPVEGSLGQDRRNDTKVGKGALEVYDLAASMILTYRATAIF